ncbi:uncharacterized protein [Tiliqua scincoides]|uniref:uncharacterized protein n=1 Tax=Tiliqua scincoides TaxID=71010 RepID=UPI0034622661
MGLLCSRIHQTFQSFFGMEAFIVLLGLDAAGKTSVLYRLKLNEPPRTIPTVGFNVEKLQPVDDITFTMWDVGGGDKIKSLWRHYYADKDGVVFVVDSVDSSRFEDARYWLQTLLQDYKLQGVPLVLLANKQDLPGAWAPMEVAEQMGLRKACGLKWHVQGCCAVSGEGLPEAMAKLAEMVKEYRHTWGTLASHSMDLPLAQNTEQSPV